MSAFPERVFIARSELFLDVRSVNSRDLIKWSTSVTPCHGTSSSSMTLYTDQPLSPRVMGRLHQARLSTLINLCHPVSWDVFIRHDSLHWSTSVTRCHGTSSSGTTLYTDQPLSPHVMGRLHQAWLSTLINLCHPVSCDVFIQHDSLHWSTSVTPCHGTSSLGTTLYTDQPLSPRVMGRLHQPRLSTLINLCHPVSWDVFIRHDSLHWSTSVTPCHGTSSSGTTLYTDQPLSHCVTGRLHQARLSTLINLCHTVSQHIFIRHDSLHWSTSGTPCHGMSSSGTTLYTDQPLSHCVMGLLHQARLSTLNNLCHTMSWDVFIRHDSLHWSTSVTKCHGTSSSGRTLYTDQPLSPSVMGRLHQARLSTLINLCHTVSWDILIRHDSLHWSTSVILCHRRSSSGTTLYTDQPLSHCVMGLLHQARLSTLNNLCHPVSWDVFIRHDSLHWSTSVSPWHGNIFIRHDSLHWSTSVTRYHGTSSSGTTLYTDQPLSPGVMGHLHQARLSTLINLYHPVSWDVFIRHDSLH